MCYAERLTKRLKLIAPKKYGNGFNVTCHPTVLDEPMKIKKPQRIFVCSMSDLFHENVPFGFIEKVMDVIETCRQHTFMILTKRPERMLEYFINLGKEAKNYGFDSIPSGSKEPLDYVPALPNLWLGVTAENQRCADERVPILLKIPAVVRFVSCEPLLSQINLRRFLPQDRYYMTRCKHCGWIGSSELCIADRGCDDDCEVFCPGCHEYIGEEDAPQINMVIAGAETGPGARSMNPDWARSLLYQCRHSNAAFFMKQMSNKEPIPDDLMIREFPKKVEDEDA